VYAITEKAAYLYNADEHELTFLTEGDYRKAAGGGQDFVEVVPVVLIIVSDYSLFDDIVAASNYGNIMPVWPAVDAGIVSQNISMFCAGKVWPLLRALQWIRIHSHGGQWKNCIKKVKSAR